MRPHFYSFFSRMVVEWRGRGQVKRRRIVTANKGPPLRERTETDSSMCNVSSFLLPTAFFGGKSGFCTHTHGTHSKCSHTCATAATLFHKPDVKSVYCMQRSFPPRLFYSRAVCREWGRGVWTDGRTVSDVRSRLCTLAVCVCSFVSSFSFVRPSVLRPFHACAHAASASVLRSIPLRRRRSEECAPPTPPILRECLPSPLLLLHVP